MYLCKALLNVCIYDKGAIKIRYNNNNNNNNNNQCHLNFCHQLDTGARNHHINT